jgi:hypothetical protein
MVWYHIFKDCLTFLVEEALRDALVEELLDSQGKPLGPWALMSVYLDASYGLFISEPKPTHHVRTIDRYAPYPANATMHVRE